MRRKKSLMQRHSILILHERRQPSLLQLLVNLANMLQKLRLQAIPHRRLMLPLLVLDTKVGNRTYHARLKQHHCNNTPQSRMQIADVVRLRTDGVFADLGGYEFHFCGFREDVDIDYIIQFELALVIEGKENKYIYSPP